MRIVEDVWRSQNSLEVVPITDHEDDRKVIEICVDSGDYARICITKEQAIELANELIKLANKL